MNFPDVNWKSEKNKNKVAMNTFKVLEHNYIFLSLIGMFSFNPAHEFFKSIKIYYTLFVVIIMLIVSSIVFIFENLSQVLFVLQGCSLIIAGIQQGGMFISTGLKMDRMRDLNRNLQTIVDKSYSLFNIFTSFKSNFLLIISRDLIIGLFF